MWRNSEDVSSTTTPPRLSLETAAKDPPVEASVPILPKDITTNSSGL